VGLSTSSGPGIEINPNVIADSLFAPTDVTVVIACFKEGSLGI
jgi:hypothetical protein